MLCIRLYKFALLAPLLLHHELPDEIDYSQRRIQVFWAWSVYNFGGSLWENEYKIKNTKLGKRVNIYLEWDITKDYKFIKADKHKKHNKIQKNNNIFIN